MGSFLGTENRPQPNQMRRALQMNANIRDKNTKQNKNKNNRVSRHDNSILEVTAWQDSRKLTLRILWGKKPSWRAK